MLNKRYLFLILIVCFFSISAVSAEDNSTSDIISVSNDVNSLEANSDINLIVNESDTLKLSNDEVLTAAKNWYVNSSKTSGGDGKSEATAVKTLNEALNKAFSGDTIMIASGEYKGNDNTRLSISKNLNFIKYGDAEAIFDAEGLSRIWTVTATSINITGLTFKNGKISNSGGAIYFKNDGSVTDCTFTHNTANHGGAIRFGNGGSVTNCTFTNNTVGMYGGAVLWVGADGTVSDCTFTDNTAVGGGAIYWCADGTVSDCTFTDNTAGGGGAIYWCADGTVSDCTFTDNTAGGGGAIYVNGDVNLKNTKFENNKAKGDSGFQCSGGAIRSKSDVTIDNCSFLNNYATDFGGAIYANSVYINSASSFINNKVGNNQWLADNDGGAIYAKDYVQIVDSIFSGNSAYDYGGAIYTQGNVNLKNTTFENNKAEGASVLQCYGGAIYAEDYVEIEDSILTGNSAVVDGGAVYAKGDVNLKNTTFENNKAEGAKISQCYGGAIRSKGDVKIDNCSFLNNHAADYGGAIYADTITWVNTLHSYFIGNYVDDNKGGAIYTSKFTTNSVKYGVFINNTVKGKDDGGAIYINKKNEITFSRCVFVNNTCGDEGGAIYLDSSQSKLTLINNIFSSNSAKEGQTAYNCGEYGTIKNNWWGGNNPSDKNDQLIEWKAWPRSNVHHSDSAPLELLLKLSENTCKINTTVRATAGFYNKDGSLYFGEMITDYISFIPTSDIEFSNRTDDKSHVTILVSPQKEGQYTITANLFNQLASDVLTAVNDSQYRQENASADVVTILPDDEELFALPNEVYELPRSLLNEPSEGLIDSPNDEETFSLLNEPSEGLIDSLNNSYNVLVNNDYNVAIDSNVEANNENTNLFSVISNVENFDHTNSTNKTPNNSSVAKTIGNQSNGSGFNYLWILLLIVIFAGAGVLIKQYKN